MKWVAVAQPVPDPVGVGLPLLLCDLGILAECLDHSQSPPKSMILRSENRQTKRDKNQGRPQKPLRMVRPTSMTTPTTPTAMWMIPLPSHESASSLT